MQSLPPALQHHRVQTDSARNVVHGRVRWAPVKSLWFTAMALGAVVGGSLYFSWAALAVFVLVTGTVLLLGHSLGSHRKLIHNSYQCPRWLEYLFVYCGVQVGLSGPLGLLRQHELRDYAQRLPDCHDYLRHGRSFWRDAWWQLHCDLVLDAPPALHIEPRLARDRFYRFLERTWMLQQLPPALALYALGGWGFVFWGVCARVTAGVFGHWLIGYFAHNHGGMHHRVDGAAVQGRNIAFTSLLTMGECWHNNHHAFPGSARLGLYAGEWDPGWWVLMVLRKAGLVWGLRLPQDLPARAELQACSPLAYRALAAPRSLAATPVPLRLRAALALAWRTARSGDASAWQVRAPSAPLPRQWLQRLVGSRPGFTVDLAERRLTLTGPGHVARGLPALCLSWCLRSPLWRMAGLCLMPVAVGVEQLRTSLDLA